MKVDKFSISFDPELGDAVRSAAAESGKPVSSWLAEAAGSKLRAEALAEFLNDWQADHGVITAEELARAERELGLTAGNTADNMTGNPAGNAARDAGACGNAE